MANPESRPRQIVVNDPLWDIYSTIAEDSGSKVDQLISQAMFEMAVRLGYVTPVAQETIPPLPEENLPLPAGPTGIPPVKKFTPGQTREASGRKPGPPGPAPKRPPRPAPRPAAKTDSKGAFIVNEQGDMEKIDKDIYIIGRSSKCDLVINSVKVSREHAIITRERGEYYIEDLGSANGTWYKGEKIEKMKLRDGDEIFICDEKFKFAIR